MIIKTIKDLENIFNKEKKNYNSKKEFSDLLGISKQNFYELEKKLNNENTQVSFLYILKLLKKLGYSVNIEKLN